MLDAPHQPSYATSSPLTAGLIAAGLTFIAALIGLRIQDAGISLFWPAAGIGAGLMLLAPSGQRRYVAAGMLAALTIANLTQQRPPLAALVFMAGNIAQSYAVARFLERASPRRFAIDSIGQATLFIVGAVVAPALVGIATAIGFQIAEYGQADLSTHWWLWLSSHSVGILCVTPAVLAIGSSRSGSRLTLEDASQFAVVTSASVVLAGGFLPESSTALLAATLLVVPLALWVIMEAGPRRAALSLLAISLVTFWQTSSQAGLFSGDVSKAQLFLLAASLLLLPLGAWPRRPRSWLQSVRVPRMSELQAAIVLVPAVFLTSVGWWTWRSTEAAAIAKVERLSSVLAVHAEHVLDAQRTIADAALAHVAGQDIAGLASDRGVHLFLSRLAQTSSTPSAISLIDLASGRAVADSTDFPPRDFDFSDRDYVRAARAAPFDTYISGVIPRLQTGIPGFTVSRVTSNQRLLAVTRPELNELLDLLAKLREHDRDVVNIVREDGIILARQPWPESGIARLPENSFTMRMLRKEVAGTSIQVSAIDGRQRMVAMRRAGSFPVYAIYGLDYARVRGEWLRQLAPLGLFSIIASFFLISFASRAQRAEVSAATARIETDAQRRLRKSEERFRLLVEQSADGIFVSDAQGRYVEVNPAGCEMLGYSRDEILTRTITDVVMPEERKRVPLETGRLAGGAVTLTEWRFRRKDGSAFIGEVVARQLPDGQLQAILRDITERHEAETRLRDSEEWLRLANEAAGIGTFDVDVPRGLARYSPELAAMLGFPGVLETRLEDAASRVHRDDAERTRALFLAALDPRGNGTLRMELRYVRPRGVVRWMTWNGKVEFSEGPNGRVPVRIVGACVDITERKQAEEALRESHARLKKVIEVETVGVMFWDLETGRMTDANETFLKLTGYSREEVEAGELTWQRLTPPEYVEASLAEIRKFEASGRVGPYEKEYLRKDGSRQWLIFAGSSLGAKSCVEFCVDISDQKRAEAAVLDSAALLRSATDNASVGLVMLDRDRRYTFVNPPYLSILGLPGTPDDYIGKGPAEVLAAVYATQISPNLDRAFAGNRVSYELTRPTSGSSAPRYYEVIYDPKRDRSDAVDGVIVTIYDLTDRKRAEQLLRNSEARLRAIVDTAADSIVVIDERAVIQSVNPATQRIFGYTTDELVGRNVAILMPVPDRDAHDNFMSGYFTTGKGAIIGRGREIKGQRKDGSTFDAELAIAEWHAEGRRYFTGIMRDITERKRDELKIQHLLTELNHRAKNLLGVVQAIALQTASSNPQAFMERFSERLEGLAASQDLLVESRWHGIEIEALARAQLSHFANLIGERIVLAGPKVSIQAAAAQTIGMALHELATNAGKYGALSNASGRVRIEWAIVSVAGKGQALRLVWSESGGPPVTLPSRRGFGTTIIDTAPRMSLDADVRLDYPPSGLSWTMICPVAAVVELSGDETSDVRGTT